MASRERTETNDQTSGRVRRYERFGARASFHTVSVFQSVRNLHGLSSYRTDYELACCFERELSLQDLNPNRDTDPPIPLSWKCWISVLPRQKSSMTSDSSLYPSPPQTPPQPPAHPRSKAPPLGCINSSSLSPFRRISPILPKGNSFSTSSAAQL